jgi:MFS transporter, Spinster family, sphingosine-1-phosphate transporter
VMTIAGMGVGPYAVGMVSDASGGNLGKAILSINWFAPVIVVMLVVLLFTSGRDTARMLERAREAGEAI